MHAWGGAVLLHVHPSRHVVTAGPSCSPPWLLGDGVVHVCARVRVVQGRAEPIEAHVNKGNRGIGFAREYTASHSVQAQRAAAASAEAAAAAEHKQASEDAAARGASRKAKLQALVAAELASEGTDAKVKRYKQIEG